MPRKSSTPPPPPNSRQEKAAAAADDKPAMSRIRQIQQGYQLVHDDDRWIGAELIGIFVVVLAIFVVGGYLLGHTAYFTVLGVLVGFLLTTIFYGRRVSHAVNTRLEKRVGGAGGALGALRRGWTVDPGIAATRNQDLVHRVVGRPGVVLVGEGVPSRLTHLLANEKRKHARVSPDTPIYDLMAGNGEGQVPIAKLAKHVMRLPANLDKKEIGELKRRLKALEAARTPAPIPKGPLPKNVKLPKMNIKR